MLAIIESIKYVLELISEYGASTIFMVVFFLMWRRSSLRYDDLQDKRLEDARKAIQALIEAKQAFAQMMQTCQSIEDDIEKMNEDLSEHIKNEVGTFATIINKLDNIYNK